MRNKHLRIPRPSIKVPKDFETDRKILEIFEAVAPFEEQRQAALNTLRKCAKNKSRVHLVIANTQSGKSKVADILCKAMVYYANKSKVEVTRCIESRAYTVIYAIGLASNDLENQARVMFEVRQISLNGSIKVEKLINIRKLLDYLHENNITPAALFIDESHLANSDISKNLPFLFRTLKNKWKHTLLFCISATPFSFISNITQNERGNDYLERLNAEVSLTIKRDGNGYQGFNEYYENGQINELELHECDFRNRSSKRDKFLHIIRSSKRRVSFIRMKAGAAREIEDIITKEIEAVRIIRLGKKWDGYKESEMTSLDDFYRLYANISSTENNSTKVVVLVRESLKAGIDLGSDIKRDIAAVWESYGNSLSSAVQGLVARTAGYIDNSELSAFVYFPMLKQYIDATNALHKNEDYRPLQQLLDDIKSNKRLPKKEQEDSFNIVDSETRITTVKKNKIRDEYEIEYVLPIDFSAEDFNVCAIASKAASLYNDTSLVEVIPAALARYRKTAKLPNSKIIRSSTAFANRYLQESYLSDKRHKLADAFAEYKSNGTHSLSFSDLTRSGKGEEHCEFAVLVASTAYGGKYSPLDSGTISALVSCIEERNKVLYSDSSTQNELVLFFVKRGKLRPRSNKRSRDGSVFHPDSEQLAA